MSRERNERIQEWILAADDGDEGAERTTPATPPGPGIEGPSPEGMNPEGIDAEEFRAEQYEVGRIWNELREGCRGLALPDGFGEERLAEWCRLRPEGVLFSAPLALAASLLGLISLVPAIGGMVLGETRLQPGGEQTAEAVVEVVAGSRWTADQSSPRRLNLSGGRNLEWTGASVEVVSLRRLRVELDEPAELSIDLGPAETLVEVEDAVLRARGCGIRIHAREDGAAWVEVERGTLRLEHRDGGLLQVLGGGERAPLRSGTGGEGTAPRVAPVIDDPGAVREPSTTFELVPGTEDALAPPVAHEPKEPESAEPFESCTVLGRVGASLGTLGAEGIRVRFVREGLPYDELLRSLPHRQPELALNRADLLRRARAEVLDRVEVDVEASGDFRAELAPGHYTMRVLAPGLVPSAPWPMRLSAGSVREVEVTLETGEALVSQVFDAEGVPVAGARVQVQHRSFETDRHGELRIPATDGSVSVIVDHPASEPYFGRLGRGRADSQIHLSRGERLVVDVRSRMGGALAGAAVRAEWISAGERFVRRAEDGPGGSKVLRGLPTRQRYQLVTLVEEPGWTVDRRVIEGTPGSLVIELSPARRVVGRVDDGEGGRIAASFGLRHDAGLIAGHTGVGDIELNRLPLYAAAQGFATQRGRRTTPFLLEPGQREFDSLSLRPDPGLRRLQVLDRAGNPASDSWVLWVLRESESRRWLAARVLEEARDTGYLLPEALDPELRAAGFEVVVWAGAAGQRSVMELDPGTEQWSLAIGESIRFH